MIQLFNNAQLTNLFAEVKFRYSSSHPASDSVLRNYPQSSPTIRSSHDVIHLAIPRLSGRLRHQRRHAQHHLEHRPGQILPILEESTGLKGEKLVNHINTCREKAWSVNPYPCIGMWLFLELIIADQPMYPGILQRLTDTGRDDRLLDFACGLGQELRKLVFDGVDAKKLYGVDLNQGLIDAGFDLFGDCTTDMTFATGDVWADDPLEKLPAGKETFDIVHVSAFFQLFSYDEQIRIAKTLASFLSDKPDALIFGWTIGTIEAGEYVFGRNGEGMAYTHNLRSFQQLWEEVGNQTCTKWNVEAMLQKSPEFFDRIANAGAWRQGFPERMFLKFIVHKS